MVSVSAINIFNYQQSGSPAKSRMPLTICPLTSDTISFGSSIGDINVIKYNKLLRDIVATADDAICSVEDAIREFEIFNFSKDTIAEYILACAYKGNKPILTINKKAVLALKRKLLEIQSIPDVVVGIRKSMDNKHKRFDIQKFKDYFDIRKRASVLRASEAQHNAEFRYVENEKRETILRALSKKAKVSEFEPRDFFKPLEEIRKSILPDLYKIHMQQGELPDELYFQMVDAVEKNNFDLQGIYRNYYSKLDSCNSLTEVRSLYPELKFNLNKPDYDKNLAQNTVNNILSKSQLLYGKTVLDALKQGHIELVPENLINVKMPNFQKKSLLALKISGFNISVPSSELIELFNRCNEIVYKYESIPDYDSKSIKDIASKEAVRKSKFWADYKRMTDNEIWMPIRFIRHRKDNPGDYTYSMDNLIDQYLASLYLKGHGHYSSNPLSMFDNLNNLTSDVINIVDGIYMPLYRKDGSIKKVDKKQYSAYVRNFDRAAIAHSIKHLENLFNGNFMAAYNSGERKFRYEAEYKKAMDLIEEKMKLRDHIGVIKSQNTKPAKKEEWVQKDLFD